MSYPVAFLITVAFWLGCWWLFACLYDATMTPPDDDDKKKKK